jgi:hypothetical protein
MRTFQIEVCTYGVRAMDNGVWVGTFPHYAYAVKFLKEQFPGCRIVRVK